MSAFSPISGSSFGTSGLTTGRAGLTNYTQTGIAGANGGYAYPPGSSMAQFMDNINNTTAQACLSPDGSEDVMTWANQLAANASTSSASGTTGALGTGSLAGGMSSLGSGGLQQMLTTLMGMISSLMGGSTSGLTDGTTSTNTNGATYNASANPSSSIYNYYGS